MSCSKAAEAASHIRLLGMDEPIMLDDRYRASLAAAKERGANVRLAVPGDIREKHGEDYVLPGFDIGLNTLEFAGWRSYSTKLFVTHVVWNSKKRSPIESDVPYRSIVVFPAVVLPNGEQLRIEGFDKLPSRSRGYGVGPL